MRWDRLGGGQKAGGQLLPRFGGGCLAHRARARRLAEDCRARPSGPGCALGGRGPTVAGLPYSAARLPAASPVASLPGWAPRVTGEPVGTPSDPS